MKKIAFAISVLLVQAVASESMAASAICKANIERFNAALMPYTNTDGMPLSEQLRHTGWAAQEMVFAVRHGCDPSRNADERAQLQEFEGMVQDTIRTCQQVTSGGDCSPKKGAIAASYRRPDLVRPGSESSPAAGTGRDSSSGGLTGVIGAGGNGMQGQETQTGERDVNQAIALAQQNQAKGEEQARKDKRRRNYPELDASECLTPVMRGGFSGFRNNCPFSVRYTYCVESPERGTGASFVDCNKQSGAGTVPANGEDFAHMKGGERLHQVACKLPGTAITRKFEGGRLWADCAKLGGN